MRSKPKRKPSKKKQRKSYILRKGETVEIYLKEYGRMPNCKLLDLAERSLVFKYLGDEYVVLHINIIYVRRKRK